MIGTLLSSMVLAAVASFAAWTLFRLRGRVVRRVARGVAVLLLVVALAPASLAAYLLGCLALGQPSAAERSLAPGVGYRRLVLREPRPVVAHVVEVDLKTARPRFVATAPTFGAETAALTGTRALSALEADLVVNANYFTPFRERDPISYYPRIGDPVQVLGPAVASGVSYGLTPPDAPGWITFWAEPSGLVGVGEMPLEATTAVSGRGWVVRSGRIAARSGPEDPLDVRPYPRTVLGLDPGGRRLFVVVVDGKQPRYSDGLTLSELGPLLLSLGVSDAIQLDGGGSSTLAIRSADGSPSLLNRPCHTKIPGRQRPVANFLGLIFSSPGRLDAGGGLDTLVPMEKGAARDPVAGEEP